ncbi:SET domain-containing protein-lysine N-methyltransferase [Dasania sp. GY-MA-18]|uniref:SET domain-containing protein-lysine N-methyltransferase n=1 Tax=Dasania phycosphaerae TaxID=2950436 RepID=A0A9J6RLM2_9GAMM|nr:MULTISPECIES: SET domain-containing protein-lysine N-methyltransferase [Dasania]MCR8922674.1 SET domain-containing protein-lysine N-methyltransferase [Dasania sp. GY-MA-18]MCZ0865104.1 SET domain-containing protein-lysine N-methyltransferase [Dasania phycosphaerae]MCZ0868830.1 SET domain-containing protein-lysine N-methyltransferase [Dasania phycosphaerae]
MKVNQLIPLPDKGLGVMARQTYSAGDCVEACSVKLLTMRQLMANPDYANKVFGWDDNYALPSGHGAFYNHSQQANMRYSNDIAAGVIRFYALCPIAAGEELTINYDNNQGHSSKPSAWFACRGLKEV